MGVVDNVGMDHFPKQGPWLGKRCRVFFNYDSRNDIGGVFVRDDYEAPHRGIIRLDDGRFVLTVECQHSVPR